MDKSDIQSLDDREGVKNEIYNPKNVTVETTTGEEVECRTYQLSKFQTVYVKPGQLPQERQPSLRYM